MERTTRKEVEQLFAWYLEAAGKRAATSWSDVGGWLLDYNPTYGGYVIREVCNAQGGQSTPITERRAAPAVFAQMLRFATATIAAAR